MDTNMPRRKFTRRTEALTTIQVARILGISTRTLYRELAAGELPEPPRNPDNGYRQWRPQDVEHLRLLLRSKP